MTPAEYMADIEDNDGESGIFEGFASGSGRRPSTARVPARLPSRRDRPTVRELQARHRRGRRRSHSGTAAPAARTRTRTRTRSHSRSRSRSPPTPHRRHHLEFTPPNDIDINIHIPPFPQPAGAATLTPDQLTQEYLSTLFEPGKDLHRALRDLILTAMQQHHEQSRTHASSSSRAPLTHNLSTQIIRTCRIPLAAVNYLYQQAIAWRDRVQAFIHYWCSDLISNMLVSPLNRLLRIAGDILSEIPRMVGGWVGDDARTEDAWVRVLDVVADVYELLDSERERGRCGEPRWG